MPLDPSLTAPPAATEAASGIGLRAVSSDRGDRHLCKCRTGGTGTYVNVNDRRDMTGGTDTYDRRDRHLCLTRARGARLKAKLVAIVRAVGAGEPTKRL